MFSIAAHHCPSGGMSHGYSSVSWEAQQLICKTLQPSLCKEMTCVRPTTLTFSQVPIFFSNKYVSEECGGREKGGEYVFMGKCEESNDDEKLLQWRPVWCKNVVLCYWDKSKMVSWEKCMWKMYEGVTLNQWTTPKRRRAKQRALSGHRQSQ